VQLAAKPRERRLIVVDPGHGGMDPGAIGLNKTREKDVVLTFARALQEAIQAAGKFDVRLTRDDDRFLSLKDRVRIARDHQADLFIAVHADTVRGQSARGATLYTLSDKASDAEAAALAEKENRADIIAGVDLGHESPEVTDILIDLVQRESRTHSMFFARKAAVELKAVTLMTGKPVRSAGFVVLKAPDVPSVLLELGYLSSHSDEELLTNPAWHKRTAAALNAAIERYFATEIAQRQ
jgi:N-acetylmuramoyl-L-alanine amidase